MRLLALSFSALALGACSVGGGYSWNGGHAGYDNVTTAAYGASANGCYVNPCQGYVPPAPVPVPQPVPCHVNPCAPVYNPPVYTPPVYTPPPPKPMPPVAPCHNPCPGGTYAVSPYAYNASMPDAHAYGTQVGGYGHAGHGHAGYAAAPADHLYTTLGAVYYDPDQPYVGIQGRFGYQATPHFGTELEASVGVIGDSKRFTNINNTGADGEIKDKVDYSVAAFGTGRLPLGQGVSALARVGYHNTKTSRDYDFDNGTTYETSDTMVGLAYGAGVEFDMSPVDGIRVDYTRYEGGDGMDSLSLAYLRRF